MGVVAPSFTQLSQIVFCIDQNLGLVTSLTGKSIPHLESGGEGGILVTTTCGCCMRGAIIATPLLIQPHRLTFKIASTF